jgi:hypothetical protein
MDSKSTTCCVCHITKGKEVCDDCNKVYSKIIGATFDTKEDIEHFFEHEDVPPYKLKKLSAEMNAYLNC